MVFGSSSASKPYLCGDRSPSMPLSIEARLFDPTSKVHFKRHDTITNEACCGSVTAVRTSTLEQNRTKVNSENAFVLPFKTVGYESWLTARPAR